MRQIIFGAAISLILGATALAFAGENSSWADTYDLLRVEGVYEIETFYLTPSGKRTTQVNRLVIVKNDGQETYSASLAVEKFGFSIGTMQSLRAWVDGEQLRFAGEGYMGGGIYGELKLNFDRKTLEIEGSLVSAAGEGIKYYRGKPIYNLSFCFYKFKDPHSRFPPLEDFAGYYTDEKGDSMLIRRYSSGTLSLLVLKKLSDGSMLQLKYGLGTYNRAAGYISFPFFDDNDRLRGKSNVIYRQDENGKSYLKLFTLGMGGQKVVRVFREKQPVLDRE
jgi:hypothetical protein